VEPTFGNPNEARNSNLAWHDRLETKNAELVYQLVVDEFEELWHGVACWDCAEDKQFKLCAMLGAWCSDHPVLCEACLQPNEGTFASCKLS
jgi:hypothetical protein